MKNRIIIDTDPGTDDAFAILLALSNDNIEIDGITVVEGNCSIENAVINTLKILELSNSTIKVYKGLKSPKSSTDYSDNAHGTNGLGGVVFDLPKGKIESESAVDYLIRTINANPQQIDIVAIGPLTNIAKAIQKSVSFANNIKRLIIMGGSATSGNITPYAEFNFHKDAKAAKIVFESNIKEIIMVGWDVTTKLPLTVKRENELLNINTKLSKFLFDVTRATAEFDRNNGYDGAVLNDPLTICYLIDSNVIELKKAKVIIDEDGIYEGRSNVEFVDKSNCYVATKVDTDKFYDILFDGVKKLN